MGDVQLLRPRFETNALVVRQPNWFDRLFIALGLFFRSIFWASLSAAGAGAASKLVDWFNQQKSPTFDRMIMGANMGNAANMFPNQPQQHQPPNQYGSYGSYGGYGQPPPPSENPFR